MSFAAKYAGRCADCDEPIRLGDSITLRDSVAIHADCEEHEQPERKTETCTTCWIIKPCECEDTE